MSEQHGNGTIKWALQLTLPAVMAAFGAYAAVNARVAVLEERIAGLRMELQLANDQNAREHARLEQSDTMLAAMLRERKR